MQGFRYRSSSVQLLIAAVFVISCVAVMAVAQADPQLPEYYKFYMKTGDRTILPEERDRDRQIANGALDPIHVGEPIAPFKLPDGFGNTIGLRDYIGKKNVVLTTMRTWW